MDTNPTAKQGVTLAVYGGTGLNHTPTRGNKSNTCLVAKPRISPPPAGNNTAEPIANYDRKTRTSSLFTPSCEWGRDPGLSIDHSARRPHRVTLPGLQLLTPFGGKPIREHTKAKKEIIAFTSPANKTKSTASTTLASQRLHELY